MLTPTLLDVAAIHGLLIIGYEAPPTHDVPIFSFSKAIQLIKKIYPPMLTLVD